MSAAEERIANIADRVDRKTKRKARKGNGVAEIWKDNLRKNRSGYIGDEYNVQHTLRHAPEFHGLVRFNAFSLEVEVTGPLPWRNCPAGSKWLETDDTALMVWLQERDINVRGRATVADSVALVAADTAFHPVRDYLDSLVWDGEPRLRVWPYDYLGASGDPVYVAAVGLRFPVSAVARIFEPGCQADHVLVLEGPQGSGKTSTARALAVQPEWFAGSLPDIHTKDAAIQLAGHWIVEVAELKAVRNSQLEAVKSFITETADTFRPPYGRRTGKFPRQCVFIATTNETDYLRDRTGNRRYWPLRCGRIDVEALTRDRDQLWAEAVHEYGQGTAWHLTADEGALAAAEQRDRVYVSEIEADVAEYLARQQAAGHVEVSVRDVLVYGLNLNPDAAGYAETARKLGSAVAEALEHCGWSKAARVRGEGVRRTVYRLTAGQGGQGK
ncbi:MAG: virulence-associated E family protein [Gammaproteobacteria bacterium PRO9]|nr:virulence-associated E family protein [Gammaproteobacteria bacterium PRO9]